MWDFVRSIDQKIIEMSKKLGWYGLVYILPWEERAKAKEFRKDDIAIAIEFDSRKFSDRAKSIRRLVEIIAVKGGNLELNRAAVSNRYVDVLISPWHGREDAGFDYVMAKLAKENEVAIGFDFSEILHKSKSERAKILSRMLDVAKLVKKYKLDFLIFSGARSCYDLRSPSEFRSFGRILGFQDPEIKKSLSGYLVKSNREKIQKQIAKGIVKIK